MAEGPAVSVAEISAYAARFQWNRVCRAATLTSALAQLESESIHILRETVAGFRNPALLFSIGKDSSVMLHLALKAFWPQPPPFPLVHIDSLWEFADMAVFRDTLVSALGVRLIVHVNEEGRDRGVTPFTHNIADYTEIMRTEGLRQALSAHCFDAAIGGARRDEERSRAKERIFSVRGADHGWDPRNQRAELWRGYNTRLSAGQTMRVFPLSNWSERDVWAYIAAEGVPVAPLYFSAVRPTVLRDGVLLMVDDARMPLNGENPVMKSIRFRTLGCYPLTGAVESHAANRAEVAAEVARASTSERGGRLIDQDEAFAMERKKKRGYF